MNILPQDEAAAILRHYLKALTERAGLRWTEANDADFDRLADLLDTGEAEVELDSIPPYQPQLGDRPLFGRMSRREIVAELLAQVEEGRASDEPPPPIVNDRVTQVFERDTSGDYGDPEFERWRKQKQAAENDRTLRRMFERERGDR